MDSTNSLFKLERLSRFTKPVWTVLVGTLLVRTTFFMAWPFLIVILYQDYQASAVMVGVMLATSSLIGSLLGLYIGYLSDIFGRKWVMVSGSLIAVFSFVGIGLANQIWQFFVLIVGTGITRQMIEAPAKSVIGDCLHDRKDRELALNLRYFAINAGGAIGPLLGIAIALHHPQPLFITTGISYLLYGITLLINLPGKRPASHDSENRPNFLATLTIIARDSIFIKMLIANFLLMFMYGQAESSLPQIIVRTGLADAAKMISGLVLVNTVTIILFQFPTLKLMESMSLFARTRIGMILVALSQIGFLFSSAEWPMGWFLSSFVLALGEVITFPTLGVQIDRLAPPHLRGAYFGAAALYSLGFAVAPVGGGILIAWYGASWLYAICTVLCGVMIGLYWLAEHQEEKMKKDQLALE